MKTLINIKDFFGTRFSESDISEADVWSPPADITETENEIIITADIPGVSKEDIDLRISEDTLEIGAQVKREEKEEEREQMPETVNAFLTNEFEGGRHQRRVDKIRAMEG